MYLVAAQAVAGTELTDPGLDLALQRLKPGAHPERLHRAIACSASART
jgi:hypothetical protein